VIGGEATDAGAGAGWNERCGNKGGSKTVDVFSIHGLDGFVQTLSFGRRIASQSVRDFFFMSKCKRFILFFR
jgi:hypothetical protein